MPAALGQKPSPDHLVPPRIALVIGNADYAAGPLPTTVNDAGLIARSLAMAGYDVTAVADADAATLQKIVTAFIGKAQNAGPSTTIVVYLSGYGLQQDGENLFVPVDAPAARDVDVAAKSLRLSALSNALDATPSKARIFIYDLARDTPFTPAGLASGLTPIEARPGSLFAFNTAPGTVAPADVGIYGAYALALAPLIDAPGLAANDVFSNLRLRVARTTNGAAVPWDDTKLPDDVGPVTSQQDGATPSPSQPLASLPPESAFFVALARDTLSGYDAYLASFTTDPLARRIRDLAAVRRESLIWTVCLRANDPAAYWTYMRRYPRGPHLLDAKRKLSDLKAALEPPPRFDLWSFGTLGLPSAEELAVLAKRPLKLVDGDEPPLPAPPSGLVPPLPDNQVDTSLPPLALPGALPIPMPTAAAKVRNAGSIVQPFVPTVGELVTRFQSAPNGTAAMVSTHDRAIVSQSEERLEQSHRVITQSASNGAVISRIIASQDGDVVTKVLTGPGGGVLTKIVTRTDASGARDTTILDGNNQLIAAIDIDKNGVTTAAKAGTVPVRDQRLVFKLGVGPKSGPTVETVGVATPKTIALPTPRAAEPAPVVSPKPATPPSEPKVETPQPQQAQTPTPPPPAPAPQQPPFAAPAAPTKPDAPAPAPPAETVAPTNSSPATPQPTGATSVLGASAPEAAPPLPPRRPHIQPMKNPRVKNNPRARGAAPRRGVVGRPAAVRGHVPPRGRHR